MNPTRSRIYQRLNNRIMNQVKLKKLIVEIILILIPSKIESTKRHIHQIDEHPIHWN